MDFTPYLVGFVVMSLSSIAIYARGSKAPGALVHTYLHASVPFIAATSYLAMTFAIGDFFKVDGTVTLIARYIDWTFTTPILLAGLVLTALQGRRETAGLEGRRETAGLEGRHGTAGPMVAIIVLDVLMIVAGLIASLAVIPFIKLVWFGWSCAAFLGVLYILWVPLRAASRTLGGPLTGAYARNLAFLSVVWILYPVVFAIGPEGVRSISTDAEGWSILVLDVVAKVIYAFYAAGNVDRALREEAGTSGEFSSTAVDTGRA